MKNKKPFHHEAPARNFGYAKALRREQTPAEKQLWRVLRNQSLENLKFRRQHPIDVFIVDFYCHELELVIEIDGGIHLLKEIKEYDVQREEHLKALGLTVIRFTNEEIFSELDAVVKKILGVALPSPLIPLPEERGGA